MNNRYIIAAIDPQNGKHNFYHDEMRGSIATIVSAEVGDGAIIRYIPEYDDRYHHVTTSTVKSAEEKDGVLVIETSNTIYTFQAIKEAEFVSVWDGGFAVTTDCKVNMVTKEVIGIDKRFALEMGQVGDVTTEYDKLINRQFERTAITIISGFSKIYDEASRVLSTSLQKKR